MGEPVYLKEAKVEVTDKYGNTFELSSLSCSGKDYLRAKEGAVEFSVPLSEIRDIKVLQEEGDRLSVMLTLSSGKREKLHVSKNLYCEGKSSIGNASFYLRDIKEISIRRER